MGPPMLNVAATRGFFTCSPAGALPRSCHAHHPSMAIPVAPMGWPLAMSPPEVLMAHSPSTPALPSHQYRAPWPTAALPKHFCADGAHHREAIVDLGHAHIPGLDPGHVISLVHRAVGALGPQNIASRFLQRIGSLSIAGDLHAVGLGHAELLQPLVGSQR